MTEPTSTSDREARQDAGEIDLTDDREYAWLLVRSDTLTGEFIKVWQAVPIRPDSTLSKMMGYPLRFTAFFSTVILTGVLMLAILIAAVHVPVTIFLYARALLPDWTWWLLLGAVGACLAGYLLLAIGVWLQLAAQGDDAGRAFAAAKEVVASEVDPSEGWNPRRSLHISHESARTGLFAGLSIGLGVVLQCIAVLGGPRLFDGPVDTGWQWVLLFGEQLFNTALLGIPSWLLPTLATIQPVSTLGRLLMTSIDLCYVAGIITMAVLVLSTTIKLRELFNGTTRDVADYLENFDISGGGKLMIHRVAVVRPLDPADVISFTKDAFLERVRRTRPPGDAPPAPS